MPPLPAVGLSAVAPAPAAAAGDGRGQQTGDVFLRSPVLGEGRAVVEDEDVWARCTCAWGRSKEQAPNGLPMSLGTQENPGAS